MEFHHSGIIWKEKYFHSSMTNGLFDYLVQALDKAQEIIERLSYELLWVEICSGRQKTSLKFLHSKNSR